MSRNLYLAVSFCEIVIISIRTFHLHNKQQRQIFKFYIINTQRYTYTDAESKKEFDRSDFDLIPFRPESYTDKVLCLKTYTYVWPQVYKS
jgi:hypothetical protein